MKKEENLLETEQDIILEEKMQNLKYDNFNNSNYGVFPKAYPKDVQNEKFREYQKTKSAELKEDLILHNLRFLRFLVYKHGKNIIDNPWTNFHTFDDLFQESIFWMGDAIEKFNPDLGFNFVSLVRVHILNKFSSIAKKYQRRINDEDGKCAHKIVSLNEKLKNKKNESNNKTEQIEIITDERTNDDNMFNIINIKEIKEEILPILPKRQRDIFEAIAIRGETNEDYAKKMGYTKAWVNAIFQKAKERIFYLYENGISDFDKMCRGVDICKNSIFENNYRICKKYGRDVLKSYVLPRLNEKDKKFFEKIVLNGCGQNTNEFANELGVGVNQVAYFVQKINELIFQKMDFIEKGLNANLKKMSAPSVEVCERLRANETLLNNYGGKVFLTRYFLKVLPEYERKVFQTGFLEFDGEDVEELAQKCELSSENYLRLSSKVLKKLKEYNLEDLNEFVDNVEDCKMEVSILSEKDMESISKRLRLIERMGGYAKVNKLLTPMLSKDEKQLFHDMFISPKFKDIYAYANYYNLGINEVSLVAKKLVKFLNQNDIKYLEKLQDKAIETVKIDAIQNSQSNKESITNTIKFWGDEDFVFAKILPILSNERDKTIAMEYFFKKEHAYDVMEILNMPLDEYEKFVLEVSSLRKKILKIVKSNNYAKLLEEYKNTNDERKSLILKKHYNTRKLSENISYYQIGNIKDNFIRRRYMEKYLKMFGGKDGIVKNVFPELESIAYKKIFISSFLRVQKDESVKKLYGIDDNDLLNAKKYIHSRLEDYKNKTNSKEK